MKVIKKVLLALTLTSVSASVLPRGGWGGGGFAAGALLGTGLTLAATSGNRIDRSPEYYDYKDKQSQRREINKDIREHKKQKREHERALNKLKKDKKLSDNEKNKKRQEHKTIIQEIEDEIKELKKDLRSL
jgi:hypothetical protein